LLCDCPGLVFPTFATTKADLVTQGILPVDQMREHTGPAALMAMRIPKRVFEWTYGVVVRKRGKSEKRRGYGEEYCRPEDLLQSYASGLRVDELVRSIEIADDHSPFF
jgi:large subunit GTPase 1